MIADPCSCCDISVQDCKKKCRPTQPTWCPVCDRSKQRRRCQSEGLYHEGDPLKELNRCCDRGCDYISRPSKFSQLRKTDLEAGARRPLCSTDIEMESSDTYRNKRHHSKPYKDKFVTLQDNGQFLNFNHEMEYVNTSLPQMTDCPKWKYGDVVTNQPYPDSGLEKHMLNGSRNEKFRSSSSKYHSHGDNAEMSLLNSKSLSFSDRDKCSAEMRERYIREMEILRSKLNLLRDGIACDGKRLRQRSESEPGFGGVTGGVPKRARDDSPKVKTASRKLPIDPTLNQSFHNFPNRHAVPFQRETKSLPPSSKPASAPARTPIVKPLTQKKATLRDQPTIQNRIIESLEDNIDSIDSDLEGSTCDEDVHEDVDADVNVSEDDDHSILSSLTSASCDSNTPSQVGETLGSITLNETPKVEHKEKPSTQLQSTIPPMSVPTSESEKLKSPIILAKHPNPFRNSLFPNVPPYVKFFMHDLKGPTLPVDITRHLKWKLSSITPIVIRRTLINSGFKLVRKSNDWTGQWGKHMKSFVFKTLKDFQKLNHFPGTFQIGRKDRLWKNLYRLMMKFGKREFGFIPRTYILPQDSKLLRSAWEKSNGSGKGQWIVKPPAAARGTGIKVVHKWGQIPKKRPLIVQKYISQPYLINGSKFDLRLYVLMTSIHPLRIYLYDDGLVRFASVKYSDDVECLSDRFMHLTNYSINKLSTQYCSNDDASSCHGHKWTLKTLWTYLDKEGVNVKSLRKNLTDLVIKTIISGESNISILSKNNLPSRYCSYELFGIDVLLDQALKPWLLEVNISPSLHSASPLDLAVKGPLVRELLNIAGFQLPGKLSKEQEEVFLESYGIKNRTHSLCYDKRIYWTTLSKEERLKQESFNFMTRNEYLNTILDDLTPDDIRHLIQFEDELTQLGRFEKVFPTPQTYVYHQFFDSPRYYNMMLDAWETKYHRNRSDGVRILENLCHQKLHLIVPFPGGKAKSSANPNDLNAQAYPEAEAESEPEAEGENLKTDSAEKEAPPSLSIVSRSNKPAKSRSSVKPSVVAKPSAKTMYLSPRRPKTSVPNLKLQEASRPSRNAFDDDKPLKETCIKMLTEMRQNGLKIIPDTKIDSLKQFPNCKLENSIISETLSKAKSNISPPKQIHNTYIKMNSSI